MGGEWAGHSTWPPADLGGRLAAADGQTTKRFIDIVIFRFHVDSLLGTYLILDTPMLRYILDAGDSSELCLRFLNLVRVHRNSHVISPSAPYFPPPPGRLRFPLKFVNGPLGAAAGCCV